MSRSPSIRSAAELAAVACRLLVLVPWSILAFEVLGDEALPGMTVRMALIAVAAIVSSRLIHGRVGQNQRRRAAIVLGGLGMGVAAASLAVPAAAGGLLWPAWLGAGVLAWSWGVALAMWSPDAGAMHGHMVLGAAGLTACVLAASHLGLWDRVSEATILLMGLWLVAVVIATALVRFAELSDRYTGVPVTRFWPPVLGALALMCLLLAVFFGLLAPLTLEALRSPAALVGSLLRGALMVVAYGLGWLVQGLIWIMRLVLRGVRHGDAEPPVMDEGPFFPDVGAEPVLSLPADVLAWVAAGALVVAGIGLTVYLLLRRQVRSEDLGIDESRESFASPGALGKWALRRWRGILSAARRRRRELVPAPRTATGYYHALLLLAARRGVTRARYTTPNRHQPAILVPFAGARNAADAILHGFSAEYYGGVSPEPGGLRELAEAWSEIKICDADRRADADR